MMAVVGVAVIVSDSSNILVKRPGKDINEYGYKLFVIPYAMGHKRWSTLFEFSQAKNSPPQPTFDKSYGLICLGTKKTGPVFHILDVISSIDSLVKFLLRPKPGLNHIAVEDTTL